MQWPPLALCSLSRSCSFPERGCGPLWRVLHCCVVRRNTGSSVGRRVPQRHVCHKSEFLSPSPNIFHLGSQFKTEISRKLRPPRNKEAQNEKNFPGFLAHGRGFSAGFLETEVVVAGVSGNGSYCCRGFWKRKLLLPWFLETEVIVAVVSGNGSHCCRGCWK